MTLEAETFARSREPRIQMRTAQRYAGIGMRVNMDSLPGAGDQAFPELSRVAGRARSCGRRPAVHPLRRSPV
jgi:hypothetical protein